MFKLLIGKYLSYAAAVFFLWVLIGQIFQANININDLIKVKGTIDTTIEVATYRYKSNTKDHELRIFLKDTSEYFRFMDIYKYVNFREKINQGDSTEIYIRPKWLVPLGLGYRNDIFEMTVNGETIFDISKTKRNNRGLIIISSLAIPLFIFIAYLNNKKLRRRKSSS